MAQVTKQANESIERMISRFRRVVIRKGIMKQKRAHKYFQRSESRLTTRRKAIFREKRRKDALTA